MRKMVFLTAGDTFSKNWNILNTKVNFMNQKFLSVIGRLHFEELVAAENWSELYDLIAQPLHEGLYEHKSFDFYDMISEGQRLFLSFDYLANQCAQGGFIQFLYNGYVPLLPDIILTLISWDIGDMASVLDNALKVYVLNRKYFNNSDSVQEFAQLYEELKEFEDLDKKFERLLPETVAKMVRYAVAHIDEFARIVDEQKN
jgi:hypothetical protein